MKEHGTSRFERICDALTRIIPQLVLSFFIAVVIGIVSWDLFLTQAAGHPESVHSYLEALYFGANIILPIIAVIGGIVAYRQLSEMQQTRQTAIYMQVMNEWNSEPVVESRMKVIELAMRYDNPAHSDPIKDRIIIEL